MTSEDNIPRDFTDEQLQTALTLAAKNAREKAFAAGLPVPFIYADRMLLRHPDGHIEDVGPVNVADAATSVCE